MLNLGIPECYAHIRDALFAILAEYDIAYLKWDHNRDLVDAGSHPDGRPGVHAQTLAVYRLLDELRAAHPRLGIESCSSGGGRVDLGILQRTDRSVIVAGGQTWMMPATWISSSIGPGAGPPPIVSVARASRPPVSLPSACDQSRSRQWRRENAGALTRVTRARMLSAHRARSASGGTLPTPGLPCVSRSPVFIDLVQQGIRA